VGCNRRVSGSMVIKVVFFDAAGTLIKPVRPIGETYAALARQYGINASAAEVAESFRTCFGSAPPLAFPGIPAQEIRGHEQDWWKRLVRRVFEPWEGFQRFDDYFAELFAYFAEPTAWTLYPEVSTTLAALQERRLALAIVSNFDSRLHTILRGLGIDHWFTAVIISSQVGHAKPALEIFQAALDRYGLGPANAVHVGDSEKHDFRGAVNAGVTGVLIDRKAAENGPKEPLLRIRSLTGLLPILDQLRKRA
jgi:putative hydrolase of the HAD superfamily